MTDWKTTPEQRQQLRQRTTWGGIPTHSIVADLADDFAMLEAELAAFRRVEDDDLDVWRDGGMPPANMWAVRHRIDSHPFTGYGETLALALADYDAKKST